MHGRTSRKKNKKISYRLNGHVGTEGAFDFRYGVAAARIKMQKSRASTRSFWMQPARWQRPGQRRPRDRHHRVLRRQAPAGRPDQLHPLVQGQGLIKTGSWIKDSKSFLNNKRDGWSKNYHVFSVQWTPKTSTSSASTARRPGARRPASPKARQYLILSLLASDYEALEMQDKKLPQHMYVDWVRVWETPQS